LRTSEFIVRVIVAHQKAVASATGTLMNTVL